MLQGKHFCSKRNTFWGTNTHIPLEIHPSKGLFAWNRHQSAYWCITVLEQRCILLIYSFENIWRGIFATHFHLLTNTFQSPMKHVCMYMMAMSQTGAYDLNKRYITRAVRRGILHPRYCCSDTPFPCGSRQGHFLPASHCWTLGSSWLFCLWQARSSHETDEPLAQIYVEVSTLTIQCKFDTNLRRSLVQCI